MKSPLFIFFLLVTFSVHAQKDTTLYGYVDSLTYRPVEIKSVFIWGQMGWNKYLKENLRFPKDALNDRIQGTVTVEFTVGIDGKVSDAKVIRSVWPSLDAEALRLIEYSPLKHSSPWVPAIQQGRQVKYRNRQDIAFKLD